MHGGNQLLDALQPGIGKRGLLQDIRGSGGSEIRIQDDAVTGLSRSKSGPPGRLGVPMLRLLVERGYSQNIAIQGNPGRLDRCIVKDILV